MIAEVRTAPSAEPLAGGGYSRGNWKVPSLAWLPLIESARAAEVAFGPIPRSMLEPHFALS
jgi:hypothetical protein